MPRNLEILVPANGKKKNLVATVQQQAKIERVGTVFVFGLASHSVCPAEVMEPEVCLNYSDIQRRDCTATLMHRR